MDATAPQQLPDEAAAAVAGKKRLKNKAKKERQKAKKAAEREDGSGTVKATAGCAAEIPGQGEEKLEQLAVKVNVEPYRLARPKQVADSAAAVEGIGSGGPESSYSRIIAVSKLVLASMTFPYMT